MFSWHSHFYHSLLLGVNLDLTSTKVVLDIIAVGIQEFQSMLNRIVSMWPKGGKIISRAWLDIIDLATIAIEQIYGRQNSNDISNWAAISILPWLWTYFLSQIYRSIKLAILSQSVFTFNAQQAAPRSLPPDPLRVEPKTKMPRCAGCSGCSALG